MTQFELIKAFLKGATEGVSIGGHNLRICNDQLIHFSTVIAERYGKKFILNVTRYSIQTGRLQKFFRESVEEEQLLLVKQVAPNYKDSLAELLERV